MPDEIWFYRNGWRISAIWYGATPAIGVTTPKGQQFSIEPKDLPGLLEALGEVQAWCERTGAAHWTNQED